MTSNNDEILHPTTRYTWRKGTAARWVEVNPVLRSGEPGYETDTGLSKVGDGINTWTVLDYTSIVYINALLDYLETGANQVLSATAAAGSAAGSATSAAASAELAEQALGLDTSAEVMAYNIDNSEVVQYSLDQRYAPRAAPLLSDLTYPIVISHRGAANIFPESTLTAYVNSAGLAAVQAIEIGDYRTVTDGGLVDFHDTTVTRTSTATGNASDYNTAGMKRLVLDSSVWFGGGWPDSGVSTLPEVLAAVGGIKLMVPEVKDLQNATASAMCRQITAQGLKSSTILQSFQFSNLEVPEAAGFARLFLTGGIAMPKTHEQIAAAGVEFVAIDHAATGDLTGWVTAAHAAGLTALAFTIDHQVDYDAAMAKGFDGIFSNDPLYAARNYAAYRRTASSWHLNGTWGHGMISIGTGPFKPTQRGSFVGAPGAYRWKPVNSTPVIAGEVSPVANPAGSYTITAKFAVEQVPADTTQGANFFFAQATDKASLISGNQPSSYLAKFRGSGGVQMWRVNAAGTATSLGTLTTTAWSIPTLSAELASGVAVTSLAVNAIPVALKTGHEFVLPTGQVVTLTANAAISATSLAVASVTPSSVVVSGASLLPFITATMTVSPSTVTATRTDESAIGTISAADTNERGGYISLLNAITVNTGAVSFHSVTVT